MEKKLKINRLIKPRTKENLGLDCSTAEFYQTILKLTLIILRLFQKTEEEETYLNSFYEASITLTQNKARTLQKRENYMSSSLMNTDTNILNRTVENLF